MVDVKELLLDYRKRHENEVGMFCEPYEDEMYYLERDGIDCMLKNGVTLDGIIVDALLLRAMDRYIKSYEQDEMLEILMNNGMSKTKACEVMNIDEPDDDDDYEELDIDEVIGEHIIDWLRLMVVDRFPDINIKNIAQELNMPESEVRNRVRNMLVEIREEVLA